MEERYVLPEVYFSREAAISYDRSKRMRQIQSEMTLRALELIGIKKGQVLDVGCGTGFSMQVLKDAGLEAVGVDISEPMLEIAEKKGFKVVLADFKELPFKKGEFDAIVSISALQWVHGKSYEEVVDYYERTAAEFRRVLKEKGKAVVQFYPKTEEEFRLAVRSFRRVGFKVTIATDYPEIPRKSKRYIILEAK
jgi:18S rRNA (guanine1575-N7)-methyltransferase